MFNEQSLRADFKKKGSLIIEYIKNEIVHIRSGKVSPSFVEKIIVNTYEGTTQIPLFQLATISADGPLGLVISPFDYNTVKDIEKALLTSPLHLNPRVEDKTIRLRLPPLSEEQRTQLLKVVSQKIEEGKMKLRIARDEIRKKVKEAFEKKECVEDQKFRFEKEIDSITRECIVQCDEMADKKRLEIMGV
ncbi:MAG TPA: ribosome-recycling factor [Patescibacteria group bacterium]|nr:ribosome-recycling factor [Patescibacteria group bacterium]